MSRRTRTFGLFLLALSSLGLSAEAGETKVSGRVVAADGKPAAGVAVGSLWDHTGGKVDAFNGVKTDAEGRFTLAVDSADRPYALMAADLVGKAGGVVVVEPAVLARPIEIKLGPLVRVHGELTSKDQAHPVTMAGVHVSIGEDGPVVAQSFSYNFAQIKPGDKMPENSGKFELRLPPGDYSLSAYEPIEPAGHLGLSLDFAVKLDRPGNVLDLGMIKMDLNPLVKLYGQEPPPLKIKDARGVPKGVKLADYKGKYVLLEFWATWCGPCIGRGIPDLMELYDEHEADRDKFVILAIHGEGADDFADLDKKLVPIVRDTWLGRPLPFPILLDDDGQTFGAYGIESIPQTILINPEGKVVEGGAEALMEALPEIPIARRIPRALDRQLQFGLGPKGAPLGKILELLAGMARVEIEPDADKLAKAGIKLDAVVPLTISGQVSLRSWLDLLLAPSGLVAVPGPDGLIVTTPDPARVKDEGPSEPQRRCAERIARKLEGRTTFDFSKATLTEVAKHFEEETTENFVLDPTDRKAGRLDPDATLTGKGEGVPLKDGLKALLAPLGIEAVIKDEVVVLIRAAQP